MLKIDPSRVQAALLYFAGNDPANPNGIEVSMTGKKAKYCFKTQDCNRQVDCIPT